MAAEFQPPEGLRVDESKLCVRCEVSYASGPCCSSHNKKLCHLCYRRTHFVEVCADGCPECAAEGLPVRLSDYGSPVSSTGEEKTDGRHLRLPNLR